MERTVRSELRFQGRLIRVEVIEVERPDGSRAIREVVRHPGASAIALLRRGEDGPQLLLVKQYRKAIESYTWEVPAGKLDVRYGQKEDPLECAIREVREETGITLTPDDLTYLGSIYTTPGFTDEVIHLWTAWVEEGSDPAPEDSEEISSARWFPISEVKEMILRGELRDSKSLAVILHLLLRGIATGS